MISVVICTYNRASSLRRTLLSLRHLVASPGLAWEVIVVNNNSTDATSAVIAEFGAGASWPVRELFEGRQGKSFGLNAAVEQACGEILAFTDDDTVVDPGWLSALVSAIEESGCIGGGGRIVPVLPQRAPRWLTFEGPHHLMNLAVFDYGSTRRMLAAPPFGPNMAFRRAAFEKYGLFRTDLGPTVGRYLPGQDTEFGRRLLAAGERLVYAPDAVVRHVHQVRKMSRRHFESWYFRYGRTSARVFTPPDQTVRIWGVPRYLFRSLVVSLGKWIVSVDSPRRFRRKLDVCQTVGEIVETFRSAPRS